MTAPLQLGSGGAWTPEQDMTEEDRRRFYKTLEGLTEGLQKAAVDLRLEGIAEPVAAVNELAIRFSDFRWHREGPDTERRPAMLTVAVQEYIADVRPVSEGGRVNLQHGATLDR